ncbi:MAG: alpha/beta fold hydrolase [Clostridia bacterium]|nr:alpha/beta fold hydrolase [Clostridia bacterium]
MKKLLSVLLSVTLVLLLAAPAGAAQNDPRTYPTIIVPGYSSCNLYLDGEKIWGLDKDAIMDTVLSQIAKYGRGLGELALRRPEYLCDLLGQEMVNYVGKLAMNPDGSSVYDVVTYDQDPAHTQYTYLRKNGGHVHEYEIMKDIAARYGSDGYDHIYAYQQDFRRSMVDCAATLDKYIDDVLDYTGAKKVNLVAVSHGGQTVASYLAMYGQEKNVVNNILMIVPAIGGAAAAYDLMSETAAIDEETLVYYLENSELMEEDVNWLVRAHQFGILDDLCNMLIHRYVKSILGYWGSIWDFIPAEYYDELKNEQLDPVESADLIAKSDYFHHEILANIRETFAACADKGMNLYIVAGSGMPAVTGLQEQSDMVITVNASTGARTAPYGSRFSDGYPQERAVCADETHNHLSPDMCVDVSGGYLPDQTWIVNGMYHGNAWRDEYSKDLCLKLFFSDERMNVYTDPAYPQFRYSSSVNYAVTATLDRSPQGYWSGEDTALTVTNLSQKYKMQLISVSVDGVDAAFGVKGIVSLEPGASCTVPVKGALPAVSLTTADITVNYSLIGCATPLGSRTLTFTVMNGDAPAFDDAAPYTAALHKTAFDKVVPNGMERTVDRSGIFDFLKMIINSMLAILRSFLLK